mgnify:CR=1 FL=1|jgi:hypothetical protein|tara:strand:- start:2329 stop:2493 length:165 start_codon:yes stop_codon:yes gene_type:complete
MGKYSTIQIRKETLKLLSDYCADNGYSKSGLIEKLIKEKIKKDIPTQNVLRVNT